ncbi:MAG: glycosyltransferase family 2 protein [FCB group bacterium]|jgi:GT2 family glycosyltransferase|nr:glycosyltransferase family 2 protein [FCB group bacterium]
MTRASSIPTRPSALHVRAQPTAATEQPGIAVVILQWNRLDETRVCCASLCRQTLPPVAVIVVDNGSTDHSPEELEAACLPGVKLIRSPRNLGFAGGCNVGIRFARELPGVDHVLLLNNDTECAEDLVERLAAELDDPRVGLVGTPMVEGEHRVAVAAGKRLWRPLALPLAARPGGRLDYLSGACLLIRGEVLRGVGLLDEGFFFFFEDADYSRRVRQAGWKLAVASGAPLFHYGSSTISRQGKMQARAYRMGHIRYLRKYHAWPRLAALPPFLYRLALDLFKGNAASLRGNLDGWSQGWAQPDPRAACRGGSPR